MAASINDKIRRLSCRGRVSVTMTMVADVISTEVDDDLVTTTNFAQVDRPEWTVRIEKRSRRYPGWATTRIDVFVWDSFGMNSEQRTGRDLDALLDTLLTVTRPPLNDLADLVYAKASS